MPAREAFRGFHPDLLAQVGASFQKALFATHGFRVDLLTEGRFEVENSLFVAEMICMQVSEEGWLSFCGHVAERSRGAELYTSTFGSGFANDTVKLSRERVGLALKYPGSDTVGLASGNSLCESARS